MSDKPAGLEFNRSVAGVVLSVASALVVGSLCAWGNVEGPAQPALIAAAAALPAAIAYDVGRRKRDPHRRLEQLRRGDLAPAVGLTTMLLVAAFFGALVFIGLAGAAAAELVTGAMLAADSQSTVDAYFTWFMVAIVVLYFVAYGGTFWAGARASHYFGDHPYLWTFRSWLVFAGMTMLWTLVNVLTADGPTQLAASLQLEMPYWVVGTIAVVGTPLTVLPSLGFAMLGTRIGRARQTKYIHAKAERLGRRLERNESSPTTLPAASASPQPDPALAPPRAEDRRPD